MKDALQILRERYPRHSIHEDEVLGVPVWMFYTIYQGDDPTAPYPYLEDIMIFTQEGISADWVPESEVKRMEGELFKTRGKR